jgi:hypothetical protein
MVLLVTLWLPKSALSVMNSKQLSLVIKKKNLLQALSWLNLKIGLFSVASESATITGDLSLTDNLIIGAQLLVNGDAQFGNAFVTGQFNVGEVSIANNYIENHQ